MPGWLTEIVRSATVDRFDTIDTLLDEIDRRQEFERIGRSARAAKLRVQTRRLMFGYSVGKEGRPML